jgi:hypothetical protein
VKLQSSLNVVYHFHNVPETGDFPINLDVLVEIDAYLID